MKNKLLCWGLLIALVLLALPLTAMAADEPVGVAYRGHIQDRGDYPADGSWVASPEIIGTVGQSKRIEGFEIKLSGTVPAGLELRYNVHVQNKGWLFAENDPTNWPQDGDYAGTRGEGLRIEAVKLVLTDGDGQAVSGYSVQYRGHVQNVGDLPADDSQWFTDGEQLGTVGSSLRLEALQVAVVKTAVDPPAPVSVVYDKAGLYGSATDNETIGGDATVAADGVTLQNLVIDGNLTISEAVGDGNVTLNNVTVTGDTVVRGGGVNSIHINGGSYQTIVMEKTASGAVRIVATGVDGLAVVIAEDAGGETIILEGAFASITVDAPNMMVTTQGQTTTIGTLTVGAGGTGSTLNLATGTTVADLVLDGTAAVKGQGNVVKAAVNADGVVFDKAPGSYVVESDVVIPPVFPAPSGGGGYTPPSKIALTISDPTVTATKVYDGTTDAAVVAGSLSGVAAGDLAKVTVTATASYDDRTVGSDKTIRVSYTLAGTAAAKYTKPADFELKTGAITAKPLTITMVGLVPTKQYDGTTAVPVNQPGTLVGIIGSDTVTPVATGNFDSPTAGPGKTITVSFALDGAQKGNYQAPHAIVFPPSGVITKKPLTIADPMLTTSKVYDGNVTAAVTAGALSGVVGTDAVTAKATASYVDKEVAEGKTITAVYTLDGNDSANYSAPANFVETTGKITAKQLTISVPAGTITKTYDGNAAVTGTIAIGDLSGVVLGDDVSIATHTAAYNDKKAGDNKAITVTYTLTGDQAGNYLPPLDTGRTGTIEKKTVGITDVVVAYEKVYDGNATAKVSNHGTILNDITGEDIALITTAWFDSATVGGGKQVTASYDFIGTDSENYNEWHDQDLNHNSVITAKPLTISDPALTISKPYDGNTTAAVTVGTLDGVVDSDNGKVTVTAVASYNSETVGTGKTITVVYTLDGPAAGNYSKPADYVVETGAIE